MTETQKPAVAEKIVIATPKADPQIFLQFGGLEDVRELIAFTGRKPRINEDGSLQIGSHALNTPCLVHATREGNVKGVYSLEEFEKQFDVKETKVFSNSFAVRKEQKNA